MADSGGVSGIGVAAVFAGGLLVWSGMKGYKVSALTKEIIAGNNPSGLKTELPVSIGGLVTSLLPWHFGGGSSPSSSGGKPSINNPVMSGSFARSVLATIGAPQTQANIDSIIAWAHREGGGGANNPLNTTLPMPGATNFNSVGVKNYSSIAVGVLATARTLIGGNYSDVMAALKSGNGLCGRSFSGLSTWSGGGYSSVC